MSKAQQLIARFLQSEGGEAKRTDVVQRLQEGLGIQENSAESYVSSYTDTWTMPDGTTHVKLSTPGPQSAPTGSQDRAAPRDQSEPKTPADGAESTRDTVTEVGAPTGDTFAELTKLEHVGHPRVPDRDRSYYHRKAIGRKSDVQVVTRELRGERHPSGSDRVQKG